jgi:hypothetical protein
MGIPADYKEADYFGNVPTSLPVSMLPLSKEHLALKECVEEQMNSHILTSAKPNGSSESEGIGVEMCPDAGLQAPIKLVGGRLWSPRILYV